MRVPAYGMTPTEQSIEFRVADGAGDPHIKLAALAAAMADGIERRIVAAGPPLRAVRRQRVRAPGGRASRHEERPGAGSRRRSPALREDRDFLLAGGIFDDGFVEAWVDLKMEQEVDAVAVRPHPYEFALYLDA